MKWILLSVFLWMLTTCAAPNPQPTQENILPMDQIRYLALGDSYTIGESVDETERWPNQLARLIESSPRSGGIEGGIEVTIIARTGWTTSELWQGIQAVNPQGTYDMVSLLIGVNNQYRGYDINEYREEFRFLLGKAIEYADGKSDHVIVLSIPDWGVTPFATGRDRGQISSEINAFNAVNLEESQKANVHYVDITPVSREAVNNPALLAGDGLHPSAEMYAEWAKLALPIAIEILSTSR